MPFDPEIAAHASSLGRTYCQLRVLPNILDNTHPTKVGIWEVPNTPPRANEGVVVADREELRALLRQLGRDEAEADPGRGSFR